MNNTDEYFLYMLIPYSLIYEKGYDGKRNKNQTAQDIRIKEQKYLNILNDLPNFTIDKEVTIITSDNKEINFHVIINKNENYEIIIDNVKLTNEIYNPYNHSKITKILELAMYDFWCDLDKNYKLPSIEEIKFQHKLALIKG